MSDPERLWWPPPADLRLPQEAIHVWRACLDRPPSQVRWLARTLTADEQLRARQLYFERDRRRFIVGRGLLRSILALYTGAEPSSLRFSYGAAGKPRLCPASAAEDLRFSVTHSHELALYAVASRREVGVDLEHIRPIDDIDRLTEQVFSPRERAIFRALPPADRWAAFFQCWTGKEAFIKGSGEGLAQALDRIDVSLAPWEAARPVYIEGNPQAAAGWWLRELRPGSGYVATLAAEGERSALMCWQWPASIGPSAHSEASSKQEVPERNI